MIEKFIQVIEESEKNILLEFPSNIDDLTGFSGNKLLGTLQRLSKLLENQENVCYLEIGVFQGLTLSLTSLASRNIPCYGIDNFAYFDPEKKNLSIVEDRLSKLKLDNAFLINKDYEDALENLTDYIGEKKIGVYFIDGPHDYRSQLMCLQLALPYLHDQAVIIVDDSNYRHVRQANRDFLITHPEYKLLFEAYTRCHPNNMSKEEEKQARDDWWNGVNIIVRDKENRLLPSYPVTERSRELYENEHLVHSAQLAEFAPQSVNLMRYLYENNIFKYVGYSLKLYYQINSAKSKLMNRFKSLNTYSETLPKSLFSGNENTIDDESIDL
jgi:predicted O-methyltransferase YrrM